MTWAYRLGWFFFTACRRRTRWWFAPTTFNTVNKWAAGITNTFATGLLCELTGAGVPILAVPLVKDELARHVAFGRSLEVLREMGVRVLFDPQAPPQSRMPGWPSVLEELHAVIRYGQGGMG